jgi:hypothetical protein
MQFSRDIEAGLLERFLVQSKAAQLEKSRVPQCSQIREYGIER